MARTAIIFDDPNDFKKMINESVKEALAELFPPKTNRSDDKSEIVDVKVAASILQLSVQTIYQNIKTIPHYKINGRLRFKPSELYQYIENNGKYSNS